MTTTEETQFDATDEAFFNAAFDDAPVSERPVSFDLEPEENPDDGDSDARPADPAASQRFHARRERLTQSVAEIVATLALIAGTAGGMHLVRGPIAASPRAAAASTPTSQRAANRAQAAAQVTPAVPAAPSTETALVPPQSDVVRHSEQHHARSSEKRSSQIRRARPATADSAARLRTALRRYRAPARDRVAPGT